MAAVALQREIEAYNDAIDKYNQQVRGYRAAVTKHNAAVDAYKDSFLSHDGDVAVYVANRHGYHIPNTDVRLHSPQADQYVRVDFGNGYFGFRYKDKLVPDPGKFTRKQPDAFTESAPSVTTGQAKRLDQPSMTDLERAGGGLINSAFNY